MFGPKTGYFDWPNYTTAAPNLVAYDPVHAKYEVIILCFKMVIYARL